jgi:hypothetical protein
MLYAFFWVIPRRLKFRRRGITQKKAYNSVIMFRQVFYECTDVSFAGRDSSVGITTRYGLDGPGI